jgi:hypothetical protein
VEIKVAHGNDNDANLASTALEQIKLKKYPGGALNPVLLGATINDGARAITAWECQGGINDTQKEQTAPMKPIMVARKVKSAKTVEDEDEEDEEERSGPRPR